MKIFNFQLLILLTAFVFSACKQQTEICDCFETRLAIKNLIKSSEDPSILEENEEFQLLKARKHECLIKIEPAYFEERQIERNGRDDKAFLLEEVGDCPAVKELFGEKL